MAPSAVNNLHREDHAGDLAKSKALHGTSSDARGGLLAMRNKNIDAQKAAIDEYFKHWENQKNLDATDEERVTRQGEYADLTRLYYELSTDLYEYGWGHSFHFCRFAPGETFYQAIARHEHYLAYKMGIQEDMTVLDVGCGVGGPAREMIKFTGCRVMGFNNNDYQIARSLAYAKKQGLEDKWAATKGDFMQMQFPDNSFDAVYAIEATVHAPRLQGVYEEIFRVLKPGGVFGVYEWLMTDNYDNTNPEHRRVRHGIEVGDGISNMVTIKEGLAAFKGAGFELMHNEDLADRPDATPWYYPLAGQWRHCKSLGDVYTIARMTKVGRGLAHRLLGVGETFKLIPPGTQKAADNLAVAADNLVAGGEQKLFTPMYLMVGRKPLN